MKCPKCGYLGFDHVDRCRNCGYEFSLSPATADPELPIRSVGPAIDSFDDFALNPTATPAQPSRAELPLFGLPTTDDPPLIPRASPPRPPLAVRRSTPEVPRVRTPTARSPNLNLALDLDVPADPQPRAVSGGAPEPVVRASAEEDAAVVARIVAGSLDLLLLGTIDAAVIYFTMQICGVTILDFGIVPKAPLLAFLVAQNVGYLVAFTAGGQTLGKMAVGIRVVPVDSGRSIDLGRASKRTVAWLLLAVPAGLGFLTAFVSRDHRGLHDRFAGTRVVRA